MRVERIFSPLFSFLSLRSVRGEKCAKVCLFCANGFATGFAKKFMATLKPFLDLRVQRKKDELYPLKISVSATPLDRIPDPL